MQGKEMNRLKLVLVEKKDWIMASRAIRSIEYYSEQVV